MSNAIARLFPRAPAPVVQQPSIPQKPTKVLEIASIVGEGMDFQGNVELSSGLRVDGSFAGNIRKKEIEAGEVVVHIAANGKVQGTIIADIIIIDGEVVGHVWAVKNLIVRGLIRGRASYGETVELSGIIEAEISRMGNMEFKDIDAMQEQMSPQGQAPATSDKVPDTPAAKTPRAVRKPVRAGAKASAESTA